MSRVEYYSPDNRYTLVFGVDHIFSTFVQLLDEQYDNDDDEPVLEADGIYGFQIHHSKCFTPKQKLKIEQLKKDFHPDNIYDVILALAKHFNIQVTEREIKAVLN